MISRKCAPLLFGLILSGLTSLLASGVAWRGALRRALDCSERFRSAPTRYCTAQISVGEQDHDQSSARYCDVR